MGRVPESNAMGSRPLLVVLLALVCCQDQPVRADRQTGPVPLAPHLNAQRVFDKRGDVQFLVQGQVSSGLHLPVVRFEQALEVQSPYVAGYKVLATFPHDRKAFTQGLFVNKGIMYESTGLYGKSSIRKVDVATGNVVQMSKFADNIFAEGIAMHKDKIFGLSWREGLGFRIDPNTLKVEEEFVLPPKVREGWGLTSDGSNLIATDSTQRLLFLDTSFQVVRETVIYDPFQKSEVSYANELEYVDGKVFANIYGLDHIAVIDPESGHVEKWIDCRGLWPGGSRDQNSVFNGIAFDNERRKFYVTGKNWPKLYEIEIN
eukprot:c39027_g1_i1.p1 GENE.c39027_g1_i1~~c39027_g1_i1.p1  ORF type:complete len:317 (-),score=84.94 c39027_g1_i1:42-992(-)